MFINDPYKNKACRTLPKTVSCIWEPTCLTVKCFITSCTPLYRVCTREKGARYVLKAHSLFDTSCQGWATPALRSTFSHQIKRGKKRRNRHLLCTHPTPSMENGTDCNESQQWSLMEQQILMSFHILHSSLGDEKPAVHYQTCSCFCKHRGLLAFSFTFIW